MGWGATCPHYSCICASPAILRSMQPCGNISGIELALERDGGIGRAVSSTAGTGGVPAWHVSVLLVSGAAMQSVRTDPSFARVPALGVGHARLSFVAERHASAYRPQECSEVVLVTVFSRRPRIARGTGRRGDSQGSDGALVFRAKPKI